MTAERRPRRVADGVRACLARALRCELQDPGLLGVVITEVEVSADLSVAQVRVRNLVGSGTSAEVRALLARLRRAAPRLRRSLGQQLALRRVPALVFHHDRGPDAARRVEELLREVAEEAGARARDPDPAADR